MQLKTPATKKKMQFIVKKEQLKKRTGLVKKQRTRHIIVFFTLALLKVGPHKEL
jgi:hypothetical protein